MYRTHILSLRQAIFMQLQDAELQPYYVNGSMSQVSNQVHKITRIKAQKLCHNPAKFTYVTNSWPIHLGLPAPGVRIKPTRNQTAINTILNGLNHKFIA